MNTTRSKMNAQKRVRVVDRPILKDRLVHWVRGEDLVNCDNRTEILRTRNLMKMKPQQLDELRNAGFLDEKLDIAQLNKPMRVNKTTPGKTEFPRNHEMDPKALDDIRKMTIQEKPEIPKSRPVREITREPKKESEISRYGREKGVHHEPEKEPEIMRYGYEKGVTHEPKKEPEIMRYGYEKGVTPESIERPEIKRCGRETGTHILCRHSRDNVTDRKMEQKKFASHSQINPNMTITQGEERVEENTENFICDYQRTTEAEVAEESIVPKFQDVESTLQISDPTPHQFRRTFEKDGKESTTGPKKIDHIFPIVEVEIPKEKVKKPRKEIINRESKSSPNKIPVIDTSIRTLSESAIFETTGLNKADFTNTVGCRGDADETGRKERDTETVVMTANEVQLVVDGKEIRINVDGKVKPVVENPPKLKQSFFSKVRDFLFKPKKKKNPQNNISIHSTQSILDRGTSKKQIKGKKVPKSTVKGHKVSKLKEGKKVVASSQLETQKSKGDNQGNTKNTKDKSKESKNKTTEVLDDDVLQDEGLEDTYIPSEDEQEETSSNSSTSSSTGSTPPSPSSTTSSPSTTQSPRSTQGSTKAPGSIRELEIASQKARKEREEKARRKKEESPFQESYRHSYAFNLRKRITRKQPVFSTYFVEHFRRFGKPPFWNYGKKPESYGVQFLEDISDKQFEEISESNEFLTTQEPSTSKPTQPSQSEHESRRTTKPAPSTKTPKIASKEKDKKKRSTKTETKSKEEQTHKTAKKKAEKKDKVEKKSTKHTRESKSTVARINEKSAKSKPKAPEHVKKDAKKSEKSRHSTSHTQRVPPTPAPRKKKIKK